MSPPPTLTPASPRGNRVRLIDLIPPIFPVILTVGRDPRCGIMNNGTPKWTILSWCKFARLLRWAHTSSWFILFSGIIGLALLIESAITQLEYDNIEGMILLSELSRRRIRSIQKLIRVGRNEVVVVLRVDKEKGE